MCAEVRRAAFAGKFYPARPETLQRDVDGYLAAGGPSPAQIQSVLGCIAPHAGYMYSGHVAGAVFRSLPARSRYIILCPNHTGRGAPLAVMSKGEWQTPLGNVRLDSELARELQDACPGITEDSLAHRDEHALEVQLPFLQRLVSEFRFVPIVVGVGDYERLEALGEGIARVLRHAAEPALIIASSDMNHYEPDGVTRIKDRKAIDRILALDPRGLYSVIREEDISMCGFAPAIAMLTAAKDLGARRAELVKYATSADTSGDRSAVVGYAGIVVSKDEPVCEPPAGRSLPS